MREVIEIEEESKKRKYEEDIERCVRNKKESWVIRGINWKIKKWKVNEVFVRKKN